VLRKCSSDHLATFSLNTLNAEIQTWQMRAPLLHGILRQAVKGSELGTCHCTEVPQQAFSCFASHYRTSFGPWWCNRWGTNFLSEKPQINLLCFLFHFLIFKHFVPNQIYPEFNCINYSFTVLTFF
jgi:hypothetical protein